MNWLIKIIKLVLSGKSEDTANPGSVKVARYTTLAAVIGLVATIFPTVWSTPPWWVKPAAPAPEPTYEVSPLDQFARVVAEPTEYSYLIVLVLGVVVVGSILVEVFARRHTPREHTHRTIDSRLS